MPKNIFLYIALAATFAFLAFFAYNEVIKPRMDNQTVAVTAQMPVSSPDLPLAFSFPSGESALTLIEPPVSTSSDGGLKKVYLLMDNQAYLKFSQDERGTPPPTISVFVLPYALAGDVADLSRVEKLRTWAVQNPTLSSFAVATTEPEKVDIDGVTAISYQTESVYKQNVQIALYDGDIYVFTGQYQSEGDDMQTKFADILQTVIFD